MVNHPVFAMAFRPLYLLAALYGALSVLLWGFGWQGTPDLAGYLWHAHEMIWGYAGAVVVAFLLTAVATWTQQPPTRGTPLVILVGLWLAARLLAFIPHTAWFNGLTGTAFFVFAAYLMGQSVFKSRNSRNYIAVAALLLFGITHAVFHTYLLTGSVPLGSLLSGLLMISTFIGLIGTRIISFFTSRKLGTAQVASPNWLVNATQLLPLLSALLMLLPIPPAIPFLLMIAAGVIGCIQTARWFEKGVVSEPMLWILFVGYELNAIGLIIMGLSHWSPLLLSLGIHLIAVGGIGLLTLGMMVRTALGHTGRPLYPAPKFMKLAFILMLLATLFRSAAALLLPVSSAAYTHSLRCAALFFAAALLLYFWRYLPWLTSPRTDGKPG